MQVDLPRWQLRLRSAAAGELPEQCATEDQCHPLSLERPASAFPHDWIRRASVLMSLALSVAVAVWQWHSQSKSLSLLSQPQLLSLSVSVSLSLSVFLVSLSLDYSGLCCCPVTSSGAPRCPPAP